MLTKETINGKEYNVVWRRKVALEKCGWVDTGVELVNALWTALPPLPRFPKNDEATIRLLSLYRGHGVTFEMCITLKSGTGIFRDSVYWWEALIEGRPLRIVHATHNNQRIDSFAIEENER